MTQLGKILKNKSGKSIELYDETMPCQKSFQPSNVIRENQAIPQRQIFCRENMVSLLMFIFMVCLLIVFFFLNSYLNEIVGRYPRLTDCEERIELFKDNLQEFKRYAQMDKDATLDGHG